MKFAGTPTWLITWQVVSPSCSLSRDLREQPRIVLIVGVDHHHDIGAGGQRLAIAGLLVAAIAVVAFVDKDF